METPFSDIEINRDYVLVFYGETLRFLIETCVQFRTDRPTTGRFYGTCTGSSLRGPRGSEVHLTWTLNSENMYNIKNIGEDGFMTLQRQLGGFIESDNINYYTPSTKKIKHLDDIYAQLGMMPSVVPEKEGPWYKPKMYGCPFGKTPSTDLVERTEYIIDVTRGEPEFTNKKKNGEISGSFIGTYVETLPPKGNSIFPKILFCDVKEIAPMIKNINSDDLSTLIKDRLLNSSDSLPSGLDDRIGKYHPGYIVGSNCILLSPLDFITREAPVSIIKHKAKHNSRKTISNGISDGCFMMGGKSRRKSKSKKRKSKRRK